MSTPAIACETGNSLTVASFAQPPSQVLGATAPRRKRNDGSSAPASGAGVGPNGGCPCPKVSVLVAAAATPPAAAAPSMSRRENSAIRTSSDEALVPTSVERGVRGDDIVSTKLGTAVALAYSGRARIAPSTG